MQHCPGLENGKSNKFHFHENIFVTLECFINECRSLRETVHKEKLNVSLFYSFIYLFALIFPPTFSSLPFLKNYAE